mgnify:FL=1
MVASTKKGTVIGKKVLSKATCFAIVGRECKTNSLSGTATKITTEMTRLFLGGSPKWFKATIVAFLLINPVMYFLFGGTVTAWLFIAEFIFTLAMALKCYPLQSGGLLAFEVLLLGLTTPENAYKELRANLEVILLLVFMVAGIYFMKPLLMYIFS